MSKLSLILFDDRTALDWEPFTLTRPAGELLFGTCSLRQRVEQLSGASCDLYLTGAHLRGFQEEGTPPVAPHEDAPAEGDRLFWLSRAVPAWEARDALRPEQLREGPIVCGGEAAGWFAPAGSPPPPAEFLLDPAAGGDAGTRVDGQMLHHVWDLVCASMDWITRDVQARFPSPPAPELPAGVHHWGEHPVIVDETARLEPGCALDTSDGPIWLDRGVVVRAFTRLCGPAYVGPDSQLLGGSVECVSIGPVCKVRGEFTSSVMLGYSNKQHDGHIGHAYLGSWVNLGAFTTNSDLKNNYGTIRLWTPHGDVDTGEIKLGCLVGDHVKTGIGLLINTGTVIGAGSNLWGAVLPPKHVPPFSWGSGEDLTEYRVDKFLQVAEAAMSRRGVELPEGMREQLRRAFERSRAPAEPEAAPAV